MNAFKEGWYLIYTKPKHEKVVSAGLVETNINYVLPTIKTLRNWTDRRKYIDAPLFPSYIFVFLKSMRDYYNGLNVAGALYYVKMGREIAQVSEKLINDILLIVKGGKDIEILPATFRPGQRVVIGEGPLTGLECEVVQYNSKRKLLVRVHLLQRDIILTLPADCVMPKGTYTI